MMKTKHGFRGFFGVIAFVALLMFAVSACDDKPDSGKTGNETGNDPKLPTELKNTEWVHTGGDRVKFGTNTVTVIPVSGTEKTFTLKDSVTVSELSQTTLYFGDGKTSDFILCRDGTISSVFLGGVQKANGWQKANGGNNNGNNPTYCTVTFDANGGTVSPSSVQVERGSFVGSESLPTPSKTTGDTVFWGWYTKNGTISGDWGNSFNRTYVYADITVYAQWGRLIDISKNVQLTEANWKAILTEIQTAGKDVNLDLSQCTRSGEDTGGGLRSDGTFDPIYNFRTGKDRIVSLVLPNAATSIERGYSGVFYSSFSYFSNLTSVSSPTVTDIGEYAFSERTSLTSVNFPAVISVGTSAFSGCTGLTSISFPAVTSIGWGAFSSTGTTAMTIILGPTAPADIDSLLFSSVDSAKTVTVKVPAGATGYGEIKTYSGDDTTENWGNGFRGAGWTGTSFPYSESPLYINSNITLHIEQN